jgi:hypothetical protein
VISQVCAVCDDGNGALVPNTGHRCFSALHGTMAFMFQEFGTPTGPSATLSRADMLALYTQSEYPAHFTMRSPNNCTGGVHGCDSCGGSDAVIEQHHHFCRCMMMADFIASGEPDNFEPFSPEAALRDDPRYQQCRPATGRRSSVTAGSQGGVQSSATAASPTDKRRAEAVSDDGENACYPYCSTDGKPSVGRYGNTRLQKPPLTSSYSSASLGLASSALSQSTGANGAVTDDDRLLMWLPHVGCFLVMVCFLGGALLILKRSQLKLAQQSQEVQLTTLTKAIRAVLDAKVIKSVSPKVKVQLGPRWTWRKLRPVTTHQHRPSTLRRLAPNAALPSRSRTSSWLVCSEEMAAPPSPTTTHMETLWHQGQVTTRRWAW